MSSPAQTAIQSPHDPHRLGRSGDSGRDGQPPGQGEGGPVPKRVVVAYGFWIFLLSDIVMFSALFATYAVLQSATAGGPGAAQLFDLSNVAIETVCLLLSSFVCGLAMIAAGARSQLWTQVGLLVTGLLGLAFVLLEFSEFARMIAAGAGPDRSAFLSAFFTLVGCHGAHVTTGLLWLGTMMAQIWTKGFRPNIMRRLMCFSLFWHALDIIWVALFTIVYLLGAGS
jgi:cytochrome o ubiquinol oxidase subunit 3